MDIIFAIIGCLFIGIHFNSTLLALGVYFCIASISLNLRFGRK